MTAAEFEARIITWAQRQPDIRALVLAGSRARGGSLVDQWSDWDFHLITDQPSRYFGTAWIEAIAPSLSVHSERTPRGVIKVSAVFAQGLEADFVPLAAWQMKLVYWAMKHPDKTAWMPRRLVRGIQETRSFMLGSGYRLLVGSRSWENRFAALNETWPQTGLSAEEFSKHVAAFWTKAVWVCKKIIRPEPRSAMHWLHLLMVNHVYVLLAEEARLAGKTPRPEGRKAEQWLEGSRLQQTALTTDIQQPQLASALLAEISLFQEVSEVIAVRRQFPLGNYGEVQAWIRAELQKLTA